MPSFHSTLESPGKSIGNIAVMPLRQTSKGTARGPAPLCPQDQEDIVDLSMPLKRSDSFPKSPLKNLEVRSCDDPKNTKFEWVTTDEATEKVVDSDNPVVHTKGSTSDAQTDYLTKVQEIFEATEC